MYAYIKGTVEEINVNSIVIENNGIGYQIMTSTNVSARLSLHENITIYTYLYIREDEMSLYGFLSKTDIEVFRLLIGISGIGPKGALSIMSVLTTDELRIAVLSDDYKAISKANGVGAKTAQRIVIDLKDKFKLEDVLGEDGDMADLPDSATNDIISETAMALTTLGYSNVEALRAVKKVNNSQNMTVEQLLKEALRHLV